MSFSRENLCLLLMKKRIYTKSVRKAALGEGFSGFSMVSLFLTNK
ncbi:hypothetical protein CTL2C_913 [Chlamydia trachomatis L2c]|nr:hypothetical protein CTL2C_913 [Chlamydia trachomatis L2c]